MNRLFALALLMFGWVLLSAVAKADERELYLDCKEIQAVDSPDIRRIQAFGIDGDATEMVVTKTDGKIVAYAVGPNSLGLESSVPLPKRGETLRYLENRHTGWSITSIDGGVIGRETIYCD